MKEGSNDVCCNHKTVTFGRPSHTQHQQSKERVKARARKDKITANIEAVTGITFKNTDPLTQESYHLVPPNKAPFGRPSRPQTPMFDLLQHHFGKLWLQQRNQFNLELQRHKKNHMARLCKNSRGSLLRHYMVLRGSRGVVRPNLKYKHIGSHLDTFRSEEDRQRSLCCSRPPHLPPIATKYSGKEKEAKKKKEEKKEKDAKKEKEEKERVAKKGEKKEEKKDGKKEKKECEKRQIDGVCDQ